MGTTRPPPSFAPPPVPCAPATATARPTAEPTSSDSSIDTLASIASTSSSSSSSQHPYSRLIVVDRGDFAAAPSSFSGLPSLPPRAGSFGGDDGGLLRRVREGIVEGSAPDFSASPDLIPTRADDFPFPSASSTSTSLPTHSHTMARARSFTPSPSSHSSTPSPRPSSSGTFSSSSSSLRDSRGTFGSYSTTASSQRPSGPIATGRPWVRDSDASSTCSRGSSGRGSSWWSDHSAGPDGEGEGEVFRVNGADGIEFLDPRPEPPGATMTINRDDPSQVVLKVVLPGFSLDNITVAMRRGHKVHIVADSYGENGGHFEKLISLGSDVVSAAPRAEFNGTELRVYVQRRTPKALPVPSPTRSLSPLPLAPSPPSLSPLALESPIVTRSTGPPPDRKPGKLAGPEGAKAAAKAAREEANQRAKEAAKSLPKVGRKIPFAAALRSATGRGPGPPPLPPPPPVEDKSSPPKLCLRVPTGADEQNRRSASPTPSGGSSNGSPGGADSGPTPTTPSSPARPRMRGSNLTLRPHSGGFVEAALWGEEEEGRPEGGSTTPKGEGQMRFTPWAK